MSGAVLLGSAPSSAADDGAGVGPDGAHPAQAQCAPVRPATARQLVHTPVCETPPRATPANPRDPTPPAHSSLWSVLCALCAPSTNRARSKHKVARSKRTNTALGHTSGDTPLALTSARHGRALGGLVSSFTVAWRTPPRSAAICPRSPRPSPSWRQRAAARSRRPCSACKASCPTNGIDEDRRHRSHRSPR